MIYRTHFSSSCGPITITCNEQAITGIGFGIHDQNDTTMVTSSLLEEARKQLLEYFAGTRKSFSLPLEANGTDFQKMVWKALCDIPYGETRSYQQIALAIGNPKATRAVGMANNRNPIGIVVPCHRVIGKDGSLTGYASGLSYKRQLLDLEARYR